MDELEEAIMESGLLEIAKNLGMAGLFLIGLVTVSKLLMKQMNARIDTLEKRSDQCEDDRKELHAKLHEVESEVIKTNTEMLEVVSQKLKC